MFFDILIVILASAGVIYLLKSLLEFLFMPEKVEGCTLFVTVSASGDVPELERMLRSAKWLAQENSAELLLLDGGLSPESRSVAEKFAAVVGYQILNTDETVNGWRQKE